MPDSRVTQPQLTKSCTACRLSKCKCEVEENGACKRCNRLGLRCIFTATRRGEPNKKRDVARLGAAVRALLRDESECGETSTESESGVAHDDHHRPHKMACMSPPLSMDANTSMSDTLSDSSGPRDNVKSPRLGGFAELKSSLERLKNAAAKCLGQNQLAQHHSEVHGMLMSAVADLDLVTTWSQHGTRARSESAACTQPATVPPPLAESSSTELPPLAESSSVAGPQRATEPWSASEGPPSSLTTVDEWMHFLLATSGPASDSTAANLSAPDPAASRLAVGATQTTHTHTVTPAGAWPQGVYCGGSTGSPLWPPPAPQRPPGRFAGTLASALDPLPTDGPESVVPMPTHNSVHEPAHVASRNWWTYQHVRSD